MRERWGHLWEMRFCETSFLLTYKGTVDTNARAHGDRAGAPSSSVACIPHREPCCHQQGSSWVSCMSAVSLITCKFLMKILGKIQRGG